MIRVNAGVKVVETLVVSDKEYQALNTTLDAIGKAFIAQNPEFEGCTISYDFGVDEHKIFINAVSEMVFTKE